MVSRSSRPHKISLLCDIQLSDVSLAHDLPLPSYYDTKSCLDVEDKLTNYHLGSDNFWYETALYLVNNKYFNHLQQQRKKFSPVVRSTVDNISYLYGDEDNFIASKILPNVPEDPKVQKPSCSGISKLQKWDGDNQTALIGCVVLCV